MTTCTAHGQAQPHCGGRVDTIDHILRRILFRNDAAFSVAPMIPVEAGRDFLVERGVGQQVTGDLLDGEAIEGHVLIKGVDHPVTPSPHGSLAVSLIAVGVGIAGRVQPANRHPLAIARRLEQPVHQLLVSAG